MTRVEVTGEKVKLRTTIFAIDGGYQERFKRRKTLSAKDWQLKSRRWHEEIVREVKEIAAERATRTVGLRKRHRSSTPERRLVPFTAVPGGIPANNLRTQFAHVIVILAEYATSLKHVQKSQHWRNVGHKMETRL